MLASVKARFFLIGSFAILLHHFAAAQPTSDYRFNYLDESDGLSNKMVSCFAEDNLGFLWFGTQNGLNRFDGHRLEVIASQQNPRTELGSYHINTLCFDDQGFLWLGTRHSGLFRYDPRTGIFRSPIYPGESNLNIQQTDVYKIVKADEQNLYAVTSDSGILKINTTLLTVEVLPLSFPGGDTLSWSLRDLIVRDGCLWVATFDQGLVKFIPGIGITSQIIHSDPSGKYNIAHITRIIEESYPNFWIATHDNYLHLLNVETGISKVYDQELYPGFSHASIYDIQKQGNDSLWLATIQGGLQVLHLKDRVIEKIISMNDSVPREFNSFISLFLSDNGTIWAGTMDRGLAYFHPATQLFERFSTKGSGMHRLSFDMVRSIEADDRSVFVGGYFGIDRIDQESKNSHTLIKEYLVRSMANHPSNENILLAGTEQGILLFVNKTTGHYRQIPLLRPPSGSRSNDEISIYKITPLNDSTVLLGTGSGLLVFNLIQKKIINHFKSDQSEQGLQSGHIRTIYIDRDENIWLGSTTGGISLFNPQNNSFRRIDFSGHEAPETNSILSFFQSKSGSYWIGTEKGLLQYDTISGVKKVFSTETGLLVNYILSIEEDDAGLIWISSPIGISSLNPSTGEVHNYTQMHGLKDLIFYLGAFVKASDGSMYFGSDNGMVRGKPMQIQSQLPKPKPYFDRITFISQPENPRISLPFVNEIKLKPGEKIFSIEVSAVDFLFNDKLRFKYRLSNLSENWIDMGNNRSIVFTDLKPGTYSLELLTSNDENTWHSQENPLTLIMVPSFFQTRSFHISIIFVLILATVTGFRLRFRILKNQRKKLNHLVAVRTEELSRSEKELMEANQTKEKLLSIIGHDLRSPFSSLLGLIQLLEDQWPEYDDEQKVRYIKGIRRNLDNVYHLVDDLLTWSRIKQNRMVPDLSVLPIKKLIDQVINELQPSAQFKSVVLSNKVIDDLYAEGDEFMLTTTLRNLISNAIKYSSRKSSVLVTAENSHDKVVMIVEDFGTGISEDRQQKLFDHLNSTSEPGTEGEKGTGLGLLVCREFVKLMNGELEFSSQPGLGSRFIVSLKKTESPVDQETRIQA